MLTIKLVKFGPQGAEQPTYTEGLTIRQAKTVHLRFEKDGRQVLQLGDAPGETIDVTIGPNDPSIDKYAEYQCAYVMNEAGRTVEIIR